MHINHTLCQAQKLFKKAYCRLISHYEKNKSKKGKQKPKFWR